MIKPHLNLVNHVITEQQHKKQTSFFTKRLFILVMISRSRNKTEAKKKRIFDALHFMHCYIIWENIIITFIIHYY